MIGMHYSWRWVVMVPVRLPVQVQLVTFNQLIWCKHPSELVSQDFLKILIGLFIYKCLYSTISHIFMHMTFYIQKYSNLKWGGVIFTTHPKKIVITTLWKTFKKINIILLKIVIVISPTPSVLICSGVGVPWTCDKTSSHLTAIDCIEVSSGSITSLCCKHVPNMYKTHHTYINCIGCANIVFLLISTQALVQSL